VLNKKMIIGKKALNGSKNIGSLFEAMQNSLPMMFGRKMFLEIETRCLADAFVGCSAGIRRLGKKIGSGEFLIFWEKSTFWWDPIFWSSLRIHANYPPKQ
jgi:hypothetical protein